MIAQFGRSQDWIRIAWTIVQGDPIDNCVTS